MMLVAFIAGAVVGVLIAGLLAAASRGEDEDGKRG